MNSCLYEGGVVHARKKPVEHKFAFRTFFFYLDLNELERVFGNSLLFSTRRTAFARFRYSDHLIHNSEINSPQDMRAEVINILRQHDVNEEIGPIRLLTQLRYLGFAMNPVNFYFCFDPTDTKIVSIIAEVNNTPWGEQHLYIIKNDGQMQTYNESRQVVSANNVAKDFHVSPFLPLNMTYDFDFVHGEQALSVKIVNYQNAERMLNVAMSLKRRTLTSNRLRVSLLKYPLISWKIFAGIYWQALRLYLKRVPFYSHPRKSSSRALADDSPVSETNNVPFTEVARDPVDEKESALINP